MSAREFAPSGAAPSPDEIAESSKGADRFAGASGGIDTFFSAVKRFGPRKAHATILAERGATDRQLMAVFCWESAREATRYTTVAGCRLTGRYREPTLFANIIVSVDS